MDKETQQIIKNIAEIQIEALKRLREKEEELNSSLSREMVLKFLGLVKEGFEQDLREAIEDEIDNRTRIYKEIIEYPDLIKTLSEYQLYLCSHILFRMEDTWIIDNYHGVYGAWEIISTSLDKFHPELTLLW